ncbi:MAG TPA: DUF2079 domain-containing protein [Acidimicrobiales bacterium]|nr:DUF2079 domain-containing protein [Acidimicrobiales bacterium]
MADVDEARAPGEVAGGGEHQSDAGQSGVGPSNGGPSNVGRRAANGELSWTADGALAAPALNLRNLRQKLDDVDPRIVAWSKYLPLAVLVVLYAVHFSQVTVAMLRAFDQPAYDMAMPDQGIWLLSRFHDPFLTVAGRNLFGDHPSFIYLVLVPVYWVYPHTSVLLVAQAMLQAAGAIPIFLLARYLLRSSFLATLLAAAYLLSPVLQQTDLEQFHVEAFETPLIALAIYAGVVWRPRLFLLCIALLLLCKEDSALYTVPLAAWVAIRRDRNVGVIAIVASAAVAAFDNLFLIPALIGYASAHGGRLPFGGLGGTLRTLARRPGQFWNYLTSQGRPWYLWQMSFSAGLFFLIAPEIAAIGLLELAANVISGFGYQHQIIYHYSMPLVAVFVCGTVYAISRLRSAASQRNASIFVVFCALWACVLWGAAPFSDDGITAPSTDTPALVGARQLMAGIPPNAVMSVVQNFVPALDHRTGIYMWPNPFHQVYYGNPKYDGTEHPAATRVQYLLLPACISCDEGTSPWQSVFAQVVPKFRVVARSTYDVLYERRNS